MTVVAIDGPSGAGKSTLARALAARLGLRHVDTGAYYRAGTLAVLHAGVDPADPGTVAKVVAAAAIDRRGGRTWLDGEDVEAAIRGRDGADAVAAEVEALTRRDRRDAHAMARADDVVEVDGTHATVEQLVDRIVALLGDVSETGAPPAGAGETGAKRSTRRARR